MIRAAEGQIGANLESVSAGRFLIAQPVLKADVDGVAGFKHLLAGLGVARLVPVERR